MKKHVSRILLFATTYSLTPSINAATALPVFRGIWYDEVQTDYYDACYNRVLKYRNKVEGDAETLAKQLLSDVSRYPECQWGDIYIDNSFHDKEPPSDFDVSRSDWDEILKNNSSPRKLRWRRDCKNSQGQILDTETSITQPSYICPKNSRIGLDTASGSFRCLHPPLPCLADIVGRDLSLTGFGFLGHVGLANQSFTDHIIEVLKEPKEAIYVHSLEQFKHFTNTAYWGEKYNLKSEKVMDIDKATKIAKTATSQYKYPFQYTLGWSYHPGGSVENYVYNQEVKQWQMINAMRKAKFRCDSFVYYSYLVGANIKIFSRFKPPFLPKHMFKEFLSCRDLEGTVCLADRNEQAFIPDNTNNELQSIFSRHPLNIQLADISTQTFVNDEHIERGVKINQLWSLAIKYQDNAEKFGYLIDILEPLRPIELAPEMIQLYKNQICTENKKHLLNALIDILYFNNQIDHHKLNNNELRNVIEMQNFMRELLYQEKDKDILKYIIQLYSSIVPASDMQRDIQAALARAEAIDSNLFTTGEQTMLSLSTAFASPKQQRNLLPSLIAKNQSNDLFLFTLCSFLSDMKSIQVDNDIKQIVADLLESNKTLLMKQTIETRSSIYQSMPICNWLNAFSNVNVNSENEKPGFMLKYIKSEPNIIMQAGLLSQLNQQAMANLSTVDKNSYKTRFIQALNERVDSDSSNDILKIAISQLRE